MMACFFDLEPMVSVPMWICIQICIQQLYKLVHLNLYITKLLYTNWLHQNKSQKEQKK
jgi:hypothetical protein